MVLKKAMLPNGYELTRKHLLFFFFGKMFYFWQLPDTMHGFPDHSI